MRYTGVFVRSTAIVITNLDGVDFPKTGTVIRKRLAVSNIKPWPPSVE